MSLHILFPNYKNYSAHENSYVPIYTKLAKKIKRQIYFYVSKDNNVNFNNKIRVFKNVKDKTLIQKIKVIIYNINVLILFFNKNKHDKKTYLLDGISITFVISVIVSCLFIKLKSNNFLIYYREPYFLNYFKKYLFSLLFYFVKKKFKSLIVLTDTIQLKKKINQKHNVQVFLLPIPHIFKSMTSKISNKKKIEILIPGQYRNDKNKKNVINFIHNNLDEDFIVRLSRNYNINIPKKTEQILEILSSKEYEKVFRRATIIILPRSTEKYFYSSSGVFIEAISLNKICFVSDNTWMAEILKKNKLNSLVINKWEELKINKIRTIIKNKKIRSSFNVLKNKIVSKNNPNVFINEIKKIL